jgi:hypothetical protein
MKAEIKNAGMQELGGRTILECRKAVCGNERGKFLL